MTILILDNSLQVTGAFNACFKNAVRLKDRHRFIYVLPAQSQLEPMIRAEGFGCYRIAQRTINRDMKNNFLFLFNIISVARQLLRIIRKERVDEVYQNEIFIIAGALARQFRTFRLVTHIRVLSRLFPRPLYKLWFSLNKAKSDKICTVSFVCKQDVESLAGPQPELEVIYDFILPEERQRPFQVRTSAPYKVLFIGNYTRGKGQDTAIAAIAWLKEMAPHLEVVMNLYGSDFNHPKNIIYRKELVTQIKERELEHCVQLHDFAEDLETVYKGHDLILNLSLAESFSFVVAEAMSYGIPVIATNSGGPAELLDGGKAGVLVPADADVIATEILTLLQDHQQREYLSRTAKERIRQLIGQYGGVERFEQFLTAY